jgi:Protein of unknown function (DUF1592)/Protein of unknown function (DUF1588)/Protein of unknown function (DUF1585)
MMRRVWAAVFMVSGLSMTLLSESPREMYQRALVQEQAVGNLKEAIALYQRVATEAGPDRNLAAKALIRAASSEEKLREPHAVDSYMQVLHMYSEQKEQVAVAQARLAALRLATPVVQASGSSAKTDIPPVVERALNTYCTTCHNQARNIANLNLEALNSQPIAERAGAWENLLRKVRARTMPPADQPRPGEGGYLTLISALEVALDQAYPVNATLSSATRVTDEELANRMAAFIWGPEAKPDAGLLDDARRGRLHDPAVLEQQVRRMLRDSKSSALTTNFFERWMLMDGLQQLSSSDRRSPELDESLLQSYENETKLFLESQIHDDRPAMELWTANYTFLNDRLARVYGVPNISGNQFRRVTLPGPERAGILGQGSFLSVTSFGNRTAPSIRGRMILKLFTGTNPPDPPPNVPPLAPTTVSADRPMRERLAEHTSNRVCANCHRIFDPLGLALENFDMIGAFRRTQGGVPIDPSGTLTDNTRFSGPKELREALTMYRDAYYNSITERMLSFALGRQGLSWKVYDYEMPTVRAVVRDAAANDYRWSAIVLGIVKSTPFQMKNVVP